MFRDLLYLHSFAIFFRGSFGNVRIRNEMLEAGHDEEVVTNNALIAAKKLVVKRERAQLEKEAEQLRIFEIAEKKRNNMIKRTKAAAAKKASVAKKAPAATKPKAQKKAVTSAKKQKTAPKVSAKKAPAKAKPVAKAKAAAKREREEAVESGESSRSRMTSNFTQTQGAEYFERPNTLDTS